MALVDQRFPCNCNETCAPFPGVARYCLAFSGNTAIVLGGQSFKKSATTATTTTPTAMPRIPKFKPTRTATGRKPWFISVPPGMTASGKRERLFFTTRDQADQAAAAIREKHRMHGANACSIPPSLAAAAATAADILKPYGASLIDAARAYAAARDAEQASYPTAEALDAWIEEISPGLRPRSVKSYKHTATRMAAAFGSRLLCTLTADELKACLMPPGTPPTAANGRHRNGRAFWNWACKQGWCEPGAFAAISPPRAKAAGEIEILTTAEAAALMQAAELHHPQAAAHFALMMFAGIRAQELVRLQARHVSPTGIELGADVTKVGLRRHITPSPTLAAWLEKYPFAPCPDWSNVDDACRYRAGWRVKPLARLVDTAGETAEEYAARPAWPQNALRHSFASYAIAAGTPLESMLFEFGHVGTPAVLRRHYLGRASKADAHKYFRILPDGMDSTAALVAV